MTQLGTIQLDTANSNLGTVDIPVFETTDVDTPLVRVQTESGVGTLSLADPSVAAYDFLRVQTSSGVMAVHDQPTAASEPTGDADVYIDFDDDDYRNQFTSLNTERNADVVNSPASSGNALRGAMPNNEHKGLSFRYEWADAGYEEPEEMWVQYYLRFDEDFEAIDGGGKLPGPAGTYGKAGWGGRESDGTNGWSARGIFAPTEDTTGDKWSPGSADPRTVPIEIGYYVYHADQGGSYGDGEGWGVELERGRWYKIDQYVKMNTPGQNDGVLRGAVDGDVVYEKSNFKFRESGYDNIRIEDYWFNLYYGGGWESPSDNYVYFDELKISRSGSI